jgi:hypothetical protein
MVDMHRELGQLSYITARKAISQNIVNLSCLN